MEENEAISRLKHGDLTGLEELVNRHQHKAVYTAYLIVQQYVLAEDIAQNAFVKLVDKISNFDEQRPFAPWFFRIIINDALKSVMQQKRIDSLSEEHENDPSGANPWLIEPPLLPEQQLEEKEEIAALRKAMDALTPDQRAVIVMKYYLQLPEIEMSKRLNRPISTVKWWLRTARKRINLSFVSDSEEEQV